LNGAQEDQRVRLQEIVEGAFQEAFWTRFAHQICSGKSLTLGPLISSLNQSINCLQRCYKDDIRCMDGWVFYGLVNNASTNY